MPKPRPKVVVLAGPNGAGKSTAAGKLLLGPLQVSEFVNADTRTLYFPLADSWKLIDNTHIRSPRLIAAGLTGGPREIYLESAWKSIVEAKQ